MLVCCPCPAPGEKGREKGEAAQLHTGLRADGVLKHEEQPCGARAEHHSPSGAGSCLTVACKLAPLLFADCASMHWADGQVFHSQHPPALCLSLTAAKGLACLHQ